MPISGVDAMPRQQRVKMPQKQRKSPLSELSRAIQGPGDSPRNSSVEKAKNLRSSGQNFITLGRGRAVSEGSSRGGAGPWLSWVCWLRNVASGVNEGQTRGPEFGFSLD